MRNGTRSLSAILWLAFFAAANATAADDAAHTHVSFRFRAFFITLFPVLLVGLCCFTWVKKQWLSHIRSAPNWRVQTLACGVFSALMFVVSMQIPVHVIGSGVDDSFVHILNRSAFGPEQFGTDLIYTYGPLGFLINAEHVNENLVLALLFWPAMYALFVAVLNVWIFSVAQGYRLMAAGAVALFAVYYVDPERFMPCFAVLLVFVGYSTPAQRSKLLLAGALMAAQGVLMKFSVGMLCGSALAGSALFPFEPRAVLRRLGLLLAGFGGSMIFLWLGLYGTLAGLYSYFANSLEIVKGYSSAMAEGQINEVSVLSSFFMGMGLIALMAALLPAGRRLHACFALVFTLFVAWKHGTVRLDSHASGMVATGYFCAAVLYIAHENPSASRFKFGLRLAAFMCVVLFLDLGIRNINVLKDDSYPVWAPPFRNIRVPNAASGTDVLKRAVFWNRFTRDLDDSALRKLPPFELSKLMKDRIGDSTVDIYSCELGFVAANPLNYKLKPVFQHFNAFTTNLDKLHADFYASPGRPKFIVYFNPLQLAGIDGRHILFDDPIAQLEMLNHYRPALAESSKACRLPVELLEETVEPRFAAPVLLQHIQAKWNHDIAVPKPAPNSILRARVKIEKPFQSKVQESLFRLSPIYINYKLTDGTGGRFRMMPTHMQDGVWIAPYFQGLTPFYQFLERKHFYAPAVASIRFDTAVTLNYAPTIDIQWEQIAELNPQLSGVQFASLAYRSPPLGEMAPRDFSGSIDAPFPGLDAPVEAVAISVGIGACENTGSVELQMLDKDNAVLAQAAVDAGSMYGDVPQIFMLSANADAARRCTKLRLSYAPKVENALSLWVYKNPEAGFEYEVYGR